MTIKRAVTRLMVRPLRPCAVAPRPRLVGLSTSKRSWSVGLSRCGRKVDPWAPAGFHDVQCYEDEVREGRLCCRMIGRWGSGSEARQADVWKEMQAIVERDPRIRIIHGTMSRQGMLGLIRACDCYVSLHRAEGFGLGMAGAMSFGRIVIGTDYSGSPDFLSAETGFPIAYDLRPVKRDEYVFWAEDQVWAEPHMDAAIAAFRLAFADVDARTRKQAAGKALVDHKYSKAAVGAAAEERIEEICREYAGRSPLLRMIGGRGRPGKGQQLGLGQLRA
jgi:glycosyltransferase involved in cell wall biosynthesis